MISMNSLKFIGWCKIDWWKEPHISFFLFSFIFLSLFSVPPFFLSYFKTEDIKILRKSSSIQWKHSLSSLDKLLGRHGWSFDENDSKHALVRLTKAAREGMS